MKTIEYKGYNLYPSCISALGIKRYQVDAMKGGKRQFNTSYCDSLKEARSEAKEAIDGFDQTAPAGDAGKQK
jgi:hypothetical protein